jgi:transcriptional regulator with XRE-family HTH domain
MNQNANILLKRDNSLSPGGKTTYSSFMKLNEKLYKRMRDQGMNQQKLARVSGISDSEVSRVMSGKSQPGLENAWKLAKALGVSVDFLADDKLDEDPGVAKPGSSPLPEAEEQLLKIARQVGLFQAAQVLGLLRFIDFDVAMRRLVDARIAGEVPASRN